MRFITRPPSLAADFRSAEGRHQRTRRRRDSTRLSAASFMSTVALMFSRFLPVAVRSGGLHTSAQHCVRSVDLVFILLRMFAMSSCCLNWDLRDREDFWDFVVGLLVVWVAPPFCPPRSPLGSCFRRNDVESAGMMRWFLIIGGCEFFW